MRRGRTAAISTGVLGLLSIGGLGFALRNPILERWYIWKLDSGNYTEKYRAALELGKLHSTKAIPQLIALMKESDDHHQEAGEACRTPGIHAGNLMAVAFHEMGDPAVPALISALKEEVPRRKRPYWRVWVCHSLGTIGTREAILALVDRLKDKDQSVRRTACGALGLIGAKARIAIPTLTEALGDDSESVRKAASIAAASLGIATMVITGIALCSFPFEARGW